MIAEAFERLYPERFQIEKMIELLGSKSTMERLARGDAPEKIASGWSDDLEQFRRMREKYLLYH
jgi:uncharacterized protein YbbC (DUF1343 family)